MWATTGGMAGATSNRGGKFIIILGFKEYNIIIFWGQEQGDFSWGRCGYSDGEGGGKFKAEPSV